METNRTTNGISEAPSWGDYGATHSDDPFLDELLSFFEDSQEPDQVLLLLEESAVAVGNLVENGAPTMPLPPPPTPRPSTADHPQVQPTLRASQPPRAGGSTTKQTIAHLRAEANALTQTLTRLRTDSCRFAKETAIAERKKRRRVEQDCQQLRDAVYQQTLFIRGLRAVISAPAAWQSENLHVDLCRYLHNYTRLPRDPSTRWHEYAALAQETRLRAAVSLLQRETAEISIAPTTSSSSNLPFIQAELQPTTDGFSVTTMSVYAVDTSDVGAVLRGTCVAVRDILSKCQSFYRCTGTTRAVVDPGALSPSTVAASFSSNIMYRVMGIHHKSLLGEDELSIESRTVTLYKQTNEYSVVLWDFVDEDELHPIQPTTDITRQAIGICLLRRERSPDGEDRVVYRSLHTRRYRLHTSTTHTPQDVLQRFHHATEQTMRANELTFRAIVVDQVAKEHAACSHALGQLTA